MLLNHVRERFFVLSQWKLKLLLLFLIFWFCMRGSADPISHCPLPSITWIIPANNQNKNRQMSNHNLTRLISYLFLYPVIEKITIRQSHSVIGQNKIKKEWEKSVAWCCQTLDLFHWYSIWSIKLYQFSNDCPVYLGAGFISV